MFVTTKYSFSIRFCDKLSFFLNFEKQIILKITNFITSISMTIKLNINNYLKFLKILTNEYHL